MPHVLNPVSESPFSSSFSTVTSSINMPRIVGQQTGVTTSSGTLPRVTPIAPPNGTSKGTSQPQISGGSNDRWWIIDYWNNPQGVFPGYTASFTAVANTIGNWATNEVILILPINIAFGTSNTNCVWFQFSIQFNHQPSIYVPVQWNIQNNNCPASSSSDYHITNIPISYVVGDSYTASMSPSSISQTTFSITDTTSGASWSMTYSIPSASVVYDSNLFSPASAVEGVPYRTSPSFTNVPYFPFTVQHGQTATSHLATASSGFNPPTTINTYHAQSANAGTWMWAMEGTPAVTSTDKTSYFQGDTIHYTGSELTPNGAEQPCLTTDITHVTCFPGAPNADSSGNVAGGLSIANNWPTGTQLFWIHDVSSNLDSVAIPLPILAAATTTTHTVTSTSTSTRATTTSTTSSFRTTTTTTTTSVNTSTVGQVCTATTTTQISSTIIALPTSTSTTSTTTTAATSTTSTYATTTSSTSTSVSTTITTTTTNICTQTQTSTTTSTTLTTFARPSTTTSLLVNPNSLNLGSSLTLSGSITQNPGAVGVTISISQDSGSTWTTLMIVSTDNSGSYSTGWTPPYPGSYLVEASWNGNNQLAGSNSPTQSLTVTGTTTPTPTLLLSAPSSGSRGQSVQLSIAVFNPTNSPLNTKMSVEIMGPNNYVMFDVVQVNVAATSDSTAYYGWTAPNQSGAYTVTVSLSPSTPSGLSTATIQIT